jgi:hypothetical protein
MSATEKKEMVNIILNRLEGQTFADWYNNGGFDDWITGDDKDREKIEKDVAKMFSLE